MIPAGWVARQSDLLAGRPEGCCSAPRCRSIAPGGICTFPLFGAKEGQLCARPLCAHHGAGNRCPAHARLESGDSKLR